MSPNDEYKKKLNAQIVVARRGALKEHIRRSLAVIRDELILKARDKSGTHEDDLTSDKYLDMLTEFIDNNLWANGDGRLQVLRLEL